MKKKEILLLKNSSNTITKKIYSNLNYHNDNGDQEEEELRNRHLKTNPK